MTNHSPSGETNTRRPLSAGDAEQLTSHVAELSAGHAPLAQGLRAAAQETSRSRLAVALTDLADQLDLGRDLNSALRAMRHPLPLHISALIRASSDTGRLGAVLAELMDQRRSTRELWRSVTSALAYPAFVLAITFALFVLLEVFVVRPIFELFKEFEIEFDAAMKSLYWWSDTGVHALVGFLGVAAAFLAVLRLALGRTRWSRVMATTPLMGPMRRWSGAAEMTRLLAMMLEQQIPLPKALMLTADGVKDPAVSQACRQLAERIEEGERLSTLVAKTHRLPALLAPLIQWGEQTGEMPEALRTASNVFAGRVKMRASFLRSALPPLAFLVVFVVVLAFLSSVVLPMFQLLQGLASFGANTPPSLNISLRFMNLGGLAILGAALLWAVQLAYGRRGVEKDDVLKRMLIIASWVLIFLGVFGFAVSLTSALSLLLLLFGVPVIIMVISQYRFSERRALLWTLAAASEKGAPLNIAARAFADQRDDEMSVRVRRLAELIEEGATLPWAFARSHNMLPPDVQIAVDMGSQTGALGPALRKAVMQGDETEETLRSLFEKCFYMFVVLAIGAGAMSFISLRIVPTTYQIFFEEFAMEPSAVSQFVINLFQWTSDFAWAPVLFAVAIGVALLLGLLKYVNLLPVDFFLIDRLTIRRDIAAIMRWLAVTVRSQSSLPEAVRVMSIRYPKKLIRDRLHKASEAINSGGDWIDNLLDVKLLKAPDAAVLRAAERVGNLSWALEEMADSVVRRFIYRMRIIMGIAFPVLLLLMGAWVLLLAVGLLLPLFQLIRGLA